MRGNEFVFVDGVLRIGVLGLLLLDWIRELIRGKRSGRRGLEGFEELGMEEGLDSIGERGGL